MGNEIVSNEDFDFFLAQDLSETDKMIAGMRALIEESENAYAAMKNQKWFQRIWYTITRKNSATVKEMQMNRDKLSMYCVHVLTRLVQQKTLSDAMLVSLTASVRNMSILHNQLQQVTYRLAKKLDEKISSVDSYQNLITDIQNGIFHRNGSLIGVIDIFSRVDERTAKDAGRLRRIRETMENNNFDFDESVDAVRFGEQVLALPEESVGRIYLFSQNHMQIGVLAYACCLIEKYFYALKSEKPDMSEKVIHEAMDTCRLTDRVSFAMGDVFVELEQSVVDVLSHKQILEGESAVSPIESRVNAVIGDMNDRVICNRNAVSDRVNAVRDRVNAVHDRLNQLNQKRVQK